MLVHERTPITRNLETEALEEIVRWPNAHPRAAFLLAGQFMAARRDQDGFDYFRGRAAARPDQPLFTSLEGLFQARAARTRPLTERIGQVQEAVATLDRAVAQAPGLTTYFRGMVLSEAGDAEAAVRDLEWVVANAGMFPVGLQRGVHRSLARSYAALGREEAAGESLRRSGGGDGSAGDTVLVADYWMTAREGFHFTSPRLVEMAPNVHVAQGYDFADFAFVVTGAGVVAIDAGTVPANVEAALAALRSITTQPITTVILTHAHWDHIGGLEALLGPGVEVIAQAEFPNELRLANSRPLPWTGFFGTEAARHFEAVPDRLVSARETVTVGGVEFVLHPVSGGETSDGLLIEMPSQGVVFTGDVMMPYLGAPFLPEGSAAGLFDTMRLIGELEPRLLVHGHTGLTDSMTIEALPGIEAALHDLHEHVTAALEEGRELPEILGDNHLPAVLRDHPAAAIPYLLMRENFTKRVHHQGSGYWRPNGDGMEVFTRDEWAAALDLVAGGGPEPFVAAARRLLEHDDLALALRILDLSLLRHPDSRPLVDLRSEALARLRERHQALNPFKFIVYSDMAGAELPRAS